VPFASFRNVARLKVRFVARGVVRFVARGDQVAK